MSRFAPAVLAVFSFAMCLVHFRPLFAEDISAELDRRLAVKCVELEIQRVELRAKYKEDSPELKAATEALMTCRELLDRQRAVLKDGLAEKQQEIEKAIQVLKNVKKDEIDTTRLQVLDQARIALMKRILELEIGVALPADDQKNGAQKQQLAAQNSALRVHLANGNTLEAEGPWLHLVPDTTRDILDQFADTAKDGAVSFRVPDQFDQESLDQLKTALIKVAPKAEFNYADKLHLLTAVCDDPAQLRRVAGVLRSVRPPAPVEGKFNPGMKGQQPFIPQDGDMKKFAPAQPNPKGKGELDDGKKKKDAVDDKF